MVMKRQALKSFLSKHKFPKQSLFLPNKTTWGWGAITRDPMGPLDNGLEQNLPCSQTGETEW